MTYAIINIYGFRFNIENRHDWWISSLVCSVNGVSTGMTGSFVVPSVFYLHSIGLSRIVMIQSMGILFTGSTLAMIFFFMVMNFLP